MASPPPSTPPGPASPPTSPTPPHGRGALWAAVAVVVVVVLVVAGLLLTGVIPGLHSNSSGSSAATSYSQSEPVAVSSADQRGGSWSVFFAGGVDSTTAVTVPNLAGEFTNDTCPLVDTPTTQPTLPAYTGAYSTGLMSGWLFGLYDSSPATLSLELVVGGQATFLGEVTAPECVDYLGTFTALTASSVVDSPVAAQAVAGAAASFVSVYSSASASAVLMAGYSISYGSLTYTVYPSWLLTYSTCGVNATSGTGIQFNATVNATNGEVLASTAPYSIACDSSGALGIDHGTMELSAPTFMAPAGRAAARALPLDRR